jgi:hypothetical protein
MPEIKTSSPTFSARIFSSVKGKLNFVMARISIQASPKVHKNQRLGLSESGHACPPSLIMLLRFHWLCRFRYGWPAGRADRKPMFQSMRSWSNS